MPIVPCDFLAHKTQGLDNWHQLGGQTCIVPNEPCCEKTGLQALTNQALQPHKIARGLKFRIWKVEGLYYLCRENKGADQLRGYFP